MRKTLGLALLALILLAVPAHAQSTAEQIAFAAYRHGQWDIFTVSPIDGSLRQLTNTPFEDTDPAFSPDGTRLAFASRREGNWDVYLLDLATGQETRLTDSPQYDGAPTWRPDGEAIAYESYQAGNLDIWQIELGNADATNLTAGSEAGDFGPAYSPTEPVIAFSSWREGSKDLFLLNPASGETQRLTNAATAEEWPAWRPDGQALAFVTDDLGDREVYALPLAEPPAAGGAAEHVTWLGRTDGPAWNPAGDAIVAVFHRWDGDQLMLIHPAAGHALPAELTGLTTIQGRLAWHPRAMLFGDPLGSLADSGESPLYTETIARSDDPNAEPYSLIRQNDITTGTPWLADTVDDSFQAWRQRLRREVGYDFLQQLSDASRDVGSYSENSQYASWHKSGRAIDTLFDYHLNGELVHQIAKENYGGETYWRTFLKCADQSGRCGRPLTANPWNYSARARTEIAPEQGGIEREIMPGYYVDMTALAREYGWDRISSYDDEKFGWTWNFIAFEYWHYQKRFETDGAANWYRAMSDVYPQTTLQKYFNWQKMRQMGDDSYLIALKGIPLPLEQKPWWALVESW